MPTLLLHYPPRKKRWRVQIDRESFTIGRSPESDVCVPLPGVSKLHAVVERKGGRFVFRDLGSRNGVALNGFPAREGALNDGDEIEIGGVLVSFYRDEPPAHVIAAMSALEPPAALEIGKEPGPARAAAPESAPSRVGAAPSAPLPRDGAGGAAGLPDLPEDDIIDPELEALARRLATPEAGYRGQTILLPRRGRPSDAEAGTLQDAALQGPGAREKDGLGVERTERAQPGGAQPGGAQPGGESPGGAETGGERPGGAETERDGTGVDGLGIGETGPEEAIEEPIEDPTGVLSARPPARFPALPFGRRGGRHHVRRHPAAGPRTLLPAPFLILLAGLAVGGGIALGFLTRWIDPQETGQGTSTDGSPGRSGRAGARNARGGEPAIDDDGGSPAVLAQVSMDDAEGARRLIVRLFLDILGRPPLRGEVRDLLGARLDDLWLRVTAKAPTPLDIAPDGLPDAFERFLGRAPRPGEVQALLEKAKGDPRYFLYHLTTSVAYAAEGSRRPRSEEQLARSLHVDLLDAVPDDSAIEKTVRALRDPAAALPGAVDVFLERSDVGPAPGEEPAAWCREQYARLLLRFPRPEEEARVVAALAPPEGWKGVLRDLATREEYRSY